MTGTADALLTPDVGELADPAAAAGVPARVPTTAASWSADRAGSAQDCPPVPGERLNRTLLTEFAYRPWLSNNERLAALDDRVRHYNTERAHSALGSRPPVMKSVHSTE